MKKNAMRWLFAAGLLLTANLSGWSQFVGSQPGTATTTKPSKMSFFIHANLEMPKGAFAALNTINVTGVDYWKQRFFGTGGVGAQTGFSIEAGLGMPTFGANPDKQSKFSFYYHPLIIAYGKYPLSWNQPYDAAKSTKPISYIEVAQRYGLGYSPIDKLQTAIYYRPGAVIPMDFEIAQTGSGGSTLSVKGTMSVAKTAPVFMMSHTWGISVKYMVFVLYYESYFAQPSYDIKISQVDPLKPFNNYDGTITGKIHYHTNTIGLGFEF